MSSDKKTDRPDASRHRAEDDDYQTIDTDNLIKDDRDPTAKDDCQTRFTDDQSSVDQTENDFQVVGDAAAGKGANDTASIGPYQLIHKIAEGGMGAVYLAEQTEPVRRRVALKVIKAGMDAREIISRFDVERQALAMMNHPNIAKILDAGETRKGAPYFAMEWVNGLPLTDYCDKYRLTIRERLQLFIPVCNAVQHAHQKGIMHRDLKPSNVLVEISDKTPVPKVIDFGLAKATEHQLKLTDKTLSTRYGAVIGTLRYMSPEQAEANHLDIDTRTDIYSLGVMLYELLIGTTPLEQNAIGEQNLVQILEMIRDSEPPRPSTRLNQSGSTMKDLSNRRAVDPPKLHQMLSGELDWVVMKALEKDRTRRYETASAFAADISRFLNDEPVLAKPHSKTYLITKFVRKNRGFVSAAAAILFLLVAGIVGTSIGLIQAEFAKKEAIQQKDVANQKTIEANKAREAAQASAQRAEQVLNIVTSSFQSANPEQGGSANMTAKDVLHQAQISMEQSGLDPRGKAKLLSALVASFIGLGDYDAAIAAATEQLDLNRAEFGEEHARTLASRTDLGESLFKSGRIPKAISLNEETTKLATSALGYNHPETLRARANLSANYARSGKPGLALQHAKQVLTIRQKELGPNHYLTLRSMTNLAIFYKQFRKTDEALQLEQQVFEQSKKTLGADHPDTLISMNNLASSYLALDQLEKAKQLFQTSYDIRKQKLGDDHVYTLRAMANLAIIDLELGETQPSIEQLESVLLEMSKKWSPDHPEVKRIRRYVKVAYQKTGQAGQIHETDAKRLSIAATEFGLNHPNTMILFNKLMNELANQGKVEEKANLEELRAKVEEIQEQLKHQEYLSVEPVD